MLITKFILFYCAVCDKTLLRRKSIENKVRKCDQRFISRKFVKHQRLSAVKVSSECNETFSTSISPAVVLQILRAAGLHMDSLPVEFFLWMRKTESLGFPSHYQG